MQTLRQTISNLRQNNKLLASDVLISDRFLASEIRNAANLIVTQQTNKRQLWSSPNVFTPILCLEMEQVPITDCCDFQSDIMVARSKKKLPNIGEGIWGLAVQRVTGLDNSKTFLEVTPKRLENIVKLKLLTNRLYYWIQNNYLYISNPDTLSVNLFAYFTEDVPNDILFPGKDCNCSTPPPISDICVNPLDKPFYFMANRMKDLEDIVTERISRNFLKLQDQKTSDNQEGN